MSSESSEQSKDFAMLLRNIRKGIRDDGLEKRVLKQERQVSRAASLVEKTVAGRKELVLDVDAWEFDCNEAAIAQVSKITASETRGDELSVARLRLELLVSARERFFKRAERLAGVELGKKKLDSQAGEASQAVGRKSLKVKNRE